MSGLRSTVVGESTLAAGYASRDYAESLREFGEIQELPTCGGWILERSVPNTNLVDGMGSYPIFSCRNWDGLAMDLDRLARRCVCVSLVTDPFAELDVARLRHAFPDVCYEYKQHFVTDLSIPIDEIIGQHHRRNVRKSTAVVTVCESTSDVDLVDQWLPLYENLTRRHSINGIATFSKLSFEQQFSVPGFVSFSAYEGETICGITLWYVRDDVVYYHLGAYTERGYQVAASFALFWAALQHFANRGVRWAGLGAGAGTIAASSGLTRFKQGWATGTRPVYFCGRILQRNEYARLSAGHLSRAGYFPAYRAA